MKSRELETQGAGYFAWAAARDAQFKSACEAQNYTDAQKLSAERMKLALELCYFNTKVYITFRKKFITVKVNKGQVRDRRNLTLLEKDYESAGYTKVVSAQGISYRIPKV